VMLQSNAPQKPNQKTGEARDDGNDPAKCGNEDVSSLCVHEVSKQWSCSYLLAAVFAHTPALAEHPEQHESRQDDGQVDRRSPEHRCVHRCGAFGVFGGRRDEETVVEKCVVG
jgi:hypothetical protein